MAATYRRTYRGPRRTPMSLVTMATALFLAVGLAVPGVAHADLGVGGETVGAPPVIGTGGGGSSTGGGGGGSGSQLPGNDVLQVTYHWGGPSAKQMSPVPATSMGTPQPPFTRGGLTRSFKGCSTTAWGPALGVKATLHYRFLKKLPSDTLNASTENRILLADSGYACIDPPHYRDQQLMCAHSIGAQAYGPYRNPFVAASKFYDVAPQPTPFVTGGMQDFNACRNLYTANFDATTSAYGQYLIRATGYQTACTYRVYTTRNAQTGAFPASHFTGCNGVFPFRVTEARLQLFCPEPGFTLDWSGNHAFTPEECLTTNDPRWSCGPQPSQSPFYAGLPGPRVEVLDDGQNRLAEWATPVLTGVQNVTDQSMMLMFDGGTPFRTGKDANAPTQPFVVSPEGVNRSVSGWAGASTRGTSGWNINFQEAGIKDQPGTAQDQPWTAHPSWRFRADFPVTEVTVRSMNVMTGQLTVATRTVFVNMTSTCTGQPLAVDVVRARTSN